MGLFQPGAPHGGEPGAEAALPAIGIGTLHALGDIIAQSRVPDGDGEAPFLHGDLDGLVDVGVTIGFFQGLARLAAIHPAQSHLAHGHAGIDFFIEIEIIPREAAEAHEEHRQHEECDLPRRGLAALRAGRLFAGLFFPGLCGVFARHMRAPADLWRFVQNITPPVTIR